MNQCGMRFQYISLEDEANPDTRHPRDSQERSTSHRPSTISFPRVWFYWYYIYHRYASSWVYFIIPIQPLGSNIQSRCLP